MYSVRLECPQDSTKRSRPEPVGVARVVAQEALPEQVRRRRQAHRRAGVPVAHLLDGVHGEDPHGVDRSPVQIRPVDPRPIPCCHLRLCSRVVLPSAVGCDFEPSDSMTGAVGPSADPSHEVCVTALDHGSSHRSSPLRVNRARSLRGTIGAFVALTKPRIIELLLVTTVPTMILAEHGLPRASLVLATLVGGTLAAASANVLNCVYDRDIDRLMHRTERRPLATGAISVPRRPGVRTACSASRRSAGWPSSSTCSPRCSRPQRDRLLRPRLHDGAQATDPAEHRVGRRRRLHAGARRLGGRDGLAGLDAVGAVPRDLPLDAAALLAAVAEVPGRLRGGGRADAARRRAAADEVADQVVVYSWAMVAASLVLWPVAGTSWFYAVVAAAAGAAFLYEAYGLRGRVRRGDRDPKPMRLFHGSITYLSVLFLAIALDPLLHL